MLEVVLCLKFKVNTKMRFYDKFWSIGSMENFIFTFKINVYDYV